MNVVKMQLGYERSHIELPYIFIDEYMVNCQPEYPLLYIWLLRNMADGKELSTEEIAKHFKLSVEDVKGAWRHWERVGLMSIQGESVIFLPIKRAAEPLKLKIAPVETRPVYTNEELAAYRTQNPDLQRLYRRAENMKGNYLSHNEVSIIFSFHDWLGLPIDVIEYLFSWCEENNKKNLRYIEKCAITWADEGIEDLEQAMIYVQNYDRVYRAVLDYMGYAGYPTKSHREHIDRWTKDWGFTLELVYLAWDKTVEYAAKPNIKYMNKILSSWYKNDINTVEAAESYKHDDAKPKRKPRQNRFINFTQREIDYELEERLEREYIERKYGLGKD